MARGKKLPIFDRYSEDGRLLGYQVKIRKKGWPAVSKQFDKLSDAQDFAIKTLDGLKSGAYEDRREAEATILSDALKRYEREVTAKKNGATQEKRRIAMWLADPLAQRSLTTIRPADLNAWIERRLSTGVSEGTTRRDIAILSHLFTVARKKWGLLAHNPVRDVDVPKQGPARDRRLNLRPDSEGKTEERRLLEAAANSRNKQLPAIIKFAIASAMRQSELLALQWENIDLELCTAHLPKSKADALRKDGKKGRTVPLAPAAIEVLEGLLVEGEDGKKRPPGGRVFPISAGRLNIHWRKAVEAAGLVNFRFHDLRHEGSSRLTESGLSPMEAATVTGHKTLSMLRDYTHLRPEEIAAKIAGKKKAEAMGLLERFRAVVEEIRAAGLVPAALLAAVTPVEEAPEAEQPKKAAGADVVPFPGRAPI